MTTVVALSFAATSAIAGELVVTQVSSDTFHYSVASPANGQADADRVKIMRDAQKLATAMGAGSYSVVRESSQNVGGSVVRHVDIKLNGAVRR
jgi:prophage tail gpP-like protein